MARKNSEAAPTLLNVKKIEKGKLRDVSIDTSGKEIHEEEASTMKEAAGEEAIKTIDEGIVQIEPKPEEEVFWQEYADVLPVDEKGRPRMKLLELPKNEEEKEVWQMWNKKLDVANREYFFHEELPTHKEVSLEEVPIVEETKKEIPASSPLPEYKNGEWIMPEKKIELPIWMQEGHEDEGDSIDQENLDNVLAQEFSKHEGELPAPNVPKAEFDDWEPPKLDDLIVLAEKARKEEWHKLPAPEGEKAKLKKSPEPLELSELVQLATEELGPKVDETADYQFDKIKNGSKKREGDVNLEIGKVAKISQELGYDSVDKIKQVSGMEKFVGKMANIFGRAKNMTETSLSRIAGSVLAAAEELKYLTKSKETKNLRKKYIKELKGVEKRITTEEKKEQKDVELLGRLRELRNILAAAK